MKGFSLIGVAALLFPSSVGSEAQLRAHAEKQSWPRQPAAPTGAPNIVLILWDDIGFADTSTFGGLAQTPGLDALAGQGLRYNNFHTAGLCSPTRAALLTGRNHHRVGFGFAGLASGYPGYNFYWRKDTASVAEVLRMNGYNTAAFGKWHNTPEWEISAAGPFDRWPTGLGFETFYGFMGGLENQWEPSRLYHNTSPVDAESRNGNYSLTRDVVDQAIEWLNTQEASAPGKPYFLYFATPGVHAPHHVPREWIERYKGRFEIGWDALRKEIFANQKRLGVVPLDAELTPRPPEVAAWSSLTVDQQRLFARQMEVYAAYISYTDHEIGRLVNSIRSAAGGDNTLIFNIVGDNGPAPAGATGYANGDASVPAQLALLEKLGGPGVPLNHYASGWAWLGATPFRGWKEQAAYLGAVRNPMVVSWPARIRERGWRKAFSHVNDIAPTIYGVVGLSPPAKVGGIAQRPFDGVSIADDFSNGPHRRKPRSQYFEIAGSRSIYQDGWIATAHPAGLWSDRTRDFSRNRWQLFDLQRDFSESQNVASKYPTKLEGLKQAFDSAARKNNVYPLGAIAFYGQPPETVENRKKFIYPQGVYRISEADSPRLGMRSFRLRAHLRANRAHADGIILSYGGREGGFVIYAERGAIVYESTKFGSTTAVLRTQEQFDLTNTQLDFMITRSTTPADGSKATITGTISIDGQVVVIGELTDLFLRPHIVPGSMSIGRPFGSDVSDHMAVPFMGKIEQLQIELID